VVKCEVSRWPSRGSYSFLSFAAPSWSPWVQDRFPSQRGAAPLVTGEALATYCYAPDGTWTGAESPRFGFIKNADGTTSFLRPSRAGHRRRSSRNRYD
jgi:hypothetical protein